eukprot:CFRG1896T1
MDAAATQHELHENSQSQKINFSLTDCKPSAVATFGQNDCVNVDGTGTEMDLCMEVDDSIAQIAPSREFVFSMSDKASTVLAGNVSSSPLLQNGSLFTNTFQSSRPSTVFCAEELPQHRSNTRPTPRKKILPKFMQAGRLGGNKKKVESTSMDDMDIDTGRANKAVKTTGGRATIATHRSMAEKPNQASPTETGVLILTRVSVEANRYNNQDITNVVELYAKVRHGSEEQKSQVVLVSPLQDTFDFFFEENAWPVHERFAIDLEVYQFTHKVEPAATFTQRFLRKFTRKRQIENNITQLPDGELIGTGTIRLKDTSYGIYPREHAMNRPDREHYMKYMETGKSMKLELVHEKRATASQLTNEGQNEKSCEGVEFSSHIRRTCQIYSRLYETSKAEYHRGSLTIQNNTQGWNEVFCIVTKKSILFYANEKSAPSVSAVKMAMAESGIRDIGLPQPIHEVLLDNVLTTPGTISSSRSTFQIAAEGKDVIVVGADDHRDCNTWLQHISEAVAHYNKWRTD